MAAEPGLGFAVIVCVVYGAACKAGSAVNGRMAANASAQVRRVVVAATVRMGLVPYPSWRTR